jgi:hypothetical protein
VSCSDITSMMTITKQSGKYAGRIPTRYSENFRDLLQSLQADDGTVLSNRPRPSVSEYRLNTDHHISLAYDVIQ